MEYTIIVNAAGEDPPGLKFIAPYAATSIGEYFMRQGEDVLVIYDDLTQHARAYRELSLLLRRPPGRQAYPGDIFYIHSRLLERSTRLRSEYGGGSLTALPIIETQAQDMSGYIPTNLISITDGQIYLSPNLFQRGIVPPVEIGRSISRVGGNAQVPAYQGLAGDLRLAYSQFEELEIFSRFSTRLDDDTQRTLERGRRVREILKQPQYSPIPVAEQVVILLAVARGYFDVVALEDMGEAEEALRRESRKEMPETLRRIAAGEKLSEEDRADVLALGERVLSAFAKSKETTDETD
jgi:F-type H+-transporting ATPase subunit alpha